MKKERPRIERVGRQSAALVSEQVAKLKEAFPEAVTEGKVDFEKLRATLGDEIDDRPERYSFTNSFHIYLDDGIRSGELKSINLKQDDLFICRDSALDDEAAANLALQYRLKTI